MPLLPLPLLAQIPQIDGTVVFLAIIVFLALVAGIYGNGNRGGKRRRKHRKAPRKKQRPPQVPQESHRPDPGVTEKIGAAGEWKLYNHLSARLPADTYTILRDIMLPDEDGGTTEIDVIVVSTYGVFVIECKNYAGWISGDATSRKWKQQLSNGNKHEFQNPLRQNHRHTSTLAEDVGLPQDVMTSIVTFSERAVFKTPMPENVLYVAQVPDYIRSFVTPRIKPEQVRDVADAIGEWDASIPEEQRAAHIANLRSRHAAKKKHHWREA